MSGKYKYSMRKAADRQSMKGAIDRLKAEDPTRYAELLKRAQSESYDARVRHDQAEREQAKRNEWLRRIEYEKARVRLHPVVTGLPDIDMSGVRGIVAFRVWGQWNGKLKSTAQSYFWREVNFADTMPTDRNQHGLHCIRLTGLGVLTSAPTYFNVGRSNVSGFIEVLGHWEEHTDGVLRAEVAKLICLFVTSDNDEIGNVVRDLYGNYPTTPVYVLNPEQLADVIMREVLRQRYMRGEV